MKVFSYAVADARAEVSPTAASFAAKSSPMDANHFAVSPSMATPATKAA